MIVEAMPGVVGVGYRKNTAHRVVGKSSQMLLLFYLTYLSDKQTLARCFQANQLKYTLS